ncbi:MAG: GNAT family N-acetyltransferase [Sphingomicrobium sp.]
MAACGLAGRPLGAARRRHFVVEDRATQRFLGRVGLWCPPGGFGPELAWAVVADARGHGIAFEAASAARVWSFAALGTDEMIHCIDDDNLPSQRLATRLGATPGERIDLFGRPARIWTSWRADLNHSPA